MQSRLAAKQVRLCRHVRQENVLTRQVSDIPRFCSIHRLMSGMRNWLLAIVVLAALLVGFGEPLVCLGFLALPFIGWRCGNLSVRISTLLVAVAGLFLHSQGYKLFGSPKIVATPRLEGAVEVAGIEPPDQVRFPNGKTVILEGVYFPQAIDLTTVGERNTLLWSAGAA